MLDNWISVWETALSAAREAHDNYASGKVFHSAMAALRKIGGNQNISDSELEQEITSPPYSFGLNASLLEDFAQIKDRKLYYAHRIEWETPILIPRNLSSDEPSNFSIESMKPETKKNIIVYAAAIIAVGALTSCLLRRSKRVQEASPPHRITENDSLAEKELVVICRAEGTVQATRGMQIEKSLSSKIMDSVRFYAHGSPSELSSSFSALEESGANTPYYWMLTFKLPTGTKVRNFDNPSLRGTEIRAVLASPQTVVKDVKHLSSLPQSSILKSYL